MKYGLERILAAAVAAALAAAWMRAVKQGLAARAAPALSLSTDPEDWPSVSVIVPAWAEQSVLSGCLVELARQDYPGFDMLLVAGGRDGTFETAVEAGRHDPRITVVAQGPHGKNNALNIGLRRATGDVLVFLDADSMVRPDYLRSLVRPLQHGFDAATGCYRPMRRSLVAAVGEVSQMVENRVRGRVMLNGSGGIAVRRSVLEQVGPFPEGPYADDWDLTARLLDGGYRLGFSPGALVITQRPASVVEWWCNELRWRRIHLRSLWRLRARLLKRPVPAAKHLLPYLTAWGAISLSAGMAGSHFAPTRPKRLIRTLSLVGLAHAMNRDLSTHITGIAFTGELSDLGAAPLVPLMSVLGWVAAALATLSPNRAPVQAKGPRPLEAASGLVTPATPPEATEKNEISPPYLPVAGAASQPVSGDALITIAIVNYNTCDELAACLSSIPADRRTPVLVLDNASTDDSVEMVQRDFPTVSLHVLPVNRGFAAGANAAVRLSRTPYVLLLNSDTRLEADSAIALAEYLDAHPEAAVAGPRLINPDGSLQPSCHSAATPLNELLRWTFLGVLAARLPVTRGRYLSRWPHTHARPVGWLVGAALAIRRSAFESVGGFDESFFMYSEEVDFMHRLRKRGWEVHFAPVTDVTHIGGASTVKQRAEMLARLYISLHDFYRRHYRGLSYLQLQVILSYFMFRNLARDLWLIRKAGGARRRQLEEDLGAWRRVLAAVWG